MPCEETVEVSDSIRCLGYGYPQPDFDLRILIDNSTEKELLRQMFAHVEKIHVYAENSGTIKSVVKGAPGSDADRSINDDESDERRAQLMEEVTASCNVSNALGWGYIVILYVVLLYLIIKCARLKINHRMLVINLILLLGGLTFAGEGKHTDEKTEQEGFLRWLACFAVQVYEYGLQIVLFPYHLFSDFANRMSKRNQLEFSANIFGTRTSVSIQSSGETRTQSTRVIINTLASTEFSSSKLYTDVATYNRMPQKSGIWQNLLLLGSLVTYSLVGCLLMVLGVPSFLWVLGFCGAGVRAWSPARLMQIWMPTFLNIFPALQGYGTAGFSRMAQVCHGLVGMWCGMVAYYFFGQE